MTANRNAKQRVFPDVRARLFRDRESSVNVAEMA